MSVRKIPKNYRNVTGITAYAKARDGGEFESTLERDYLTLLEFDPLVVDFAVQPLKIQWRDGAGTNHMYTPDVLVSYKAETQRMPLLVEVKYRSELRQKWNVLRPKFKAAVHECHLRNWQFKLMTEVEIRTPFLYNAKFLLPFVRQNLPPSDVVTNVLAKMRNGSVLELLKKITHEPWEQAALLPSIWTMVATGHICCDLYQPLTMESQIWHANR